MTRALTLALVNGRVRTLDPDRAFATAVGVAGDRIATVGDDASVLADATSRTEVVDLKGAALIPGVTDGHAHPFEAARGARGVDLRAARTLEDVRQALAGERRRQPGDWVFAYNLAYDVFAGCEVRGALVADAVGGAPALLTFDDLHTALASPRALALAGLDGPRVLPERAEVVVDADGAPTGELRERGAIRLVRDVAPTLTAHEHYALCATQLRRLAAAGLTGAHVMDGRLETLDLLRELEGNGDLVTRLVVPYVVLPGMSQSDWAALARHRDEGGGRWRAGVVKLFIDGVIDTGTGWLFEPDSEGGGTLPAWDDVDDYARAVAFFAEQGFQVVTHATGDRAVHEALNAYKKAGAAPGVRHRVEHLETVQTDDVVRFATEGVVASLQPQHMADLAPDRSDHWSRRLGPERTRRAFPVRDLVESGATVVLGSDWPVASYDWREGLAAAQLRRPAGRTARAAFDDQGVDALAALRGYTRNAAQATGAAGELGRIAPGFVADLTAIADDPVTVPADEIVDVPIVATVVAGRPVHRHQEL